MQDSNEELEIFRTRSLQCQLASAFERSPDSWIEDDSDSVTRSTQDPVDDAEP
jgi:hypothetical protein